MLTDVRKLAAIMFTDIAGYTAMVQKDEADALRKVSRHRKHLEDSTALFQGQVIQFYGDGSLSIYESVVDAVRCAIAMQHAYQQHDHVPVRIGIHLGDFVIKDGTVFGDGINVASRIQAEGIPGAILISDKVNREIINHSDIKTTLLGAFELKNVAGPQKIYAVATPGLAIPRKKNKARDYVKKRALYFIPLVAIGLTLLTVQYFREKVPPISNTWRDERIAVPEFIDGVSKPEFAALSKMAAHWITTELIESVHASVVSYQSAVENPQVALAAAGPQKFADRTGAVNAIQGSYLLRTPDTLEFFANILNLKTGEYIQALSGITCPSSDPLKCIRELASSIKGFWQSRNESLLQLPKYEAYVKYLEARALWFDDDDKAEVLLNEAIAIDPNFIDAYFLMLDLFYNHRQFETAALMIAEIKSRFPNMTERQKNFLAYHDADNHGRNVEAFNHFMSEYALDPKDIFINASGMVMASEYVNSPDKVLQFFEEIPVDSANLGSCTYCQNRWSIAIRANVMLGKLRQARQLADQLRNHDLHDFRCYQRLVEFYVVSNDTASAQRILSETETEVEPRFRPYMYFVAGRQAHLKGRTELRDHYARKAITLSPDSSRMLARCWYLMEDLDKALAIYEMALSKDSTDNQLYAELGVIYARKKDNDRARQMIEKIQSMKPKYDFGYTPYCQGRIAANMGDRDTALKYLKQALDEGVKFRASIEFLEDPDLAMLRNDQEYKKLLKRI